MTTIPVDSAVATPIVLPVSKAALWLAGAVMMALAMYYLVGMEQGALALFGSKNLVVHEFVHDARHFLGFPCH